MTPKTKTKSNFMQLSKVPPEKVVWLWHPYLPIGHLSMIHGRGDMGKSHVTSSLAALVSKGKAFPGTNGTRPDQKVLILSAEDVLESVLVPRLIGLAAKMTNIYVPSRDYTFDLMGLKIFEEDIVAIEPTLVIVDPIVHYLGARVDMNKANEVRAVMSKLTKLAKRYDLAIILVAHDRKSKPGDNSIDVDAVSGSADFRNAVRNSLAAIRLPDGNKQLIHDKHNLSEKGMALPYGWVDGEFEWGEPIDDSEIGLDTPTGRPREQAAAFLKAIMRDGPVPATEVFARGLALGLSKKTLERAKTGIVYSHYEMSSGARKWWFVPLGIKFIHPDATPEELAQAKKSAKGFKDGTRQAEVRNVGDREPVEVPQPGDEQGHLLRPLHREVEGVRSTGKEVPETGRDRGHPATRTDGGGGIATEFQNKIQEMLADIEEENRMNSHA